MKITERSLGLRVRLFIWVITLIIAYTSTCRAGDPWVIPDPKFCGRLLILISGAGEAGKYIGGGLGEDIDLKDPNAAYTYSDFLQFRRNNPKGAPSYCVVVTSDASLRKTLGELPSKLREEAGFLGMVPASVDSVGKLLSDDGSSLIAQAFAKFSECSECRALMQTEGANSVAQFIKTEVVIESENAEGAIPLWPTSTGSGTAIDWLNLAAPPTLDKQLISSLLNRLGSGVIQTFVESCDGTSIGNCFLRNDINSSYQSITGPDTLLLVGGRNPPFFTWSRKEGENHPVALRKPTICDSMAGITPLLFSKFSKYYTVSSDRKIAEPVFAAGDYINPLDSFLYTSVDARAARVLRTFISSRIDSSIAEHLLSAGFSESAGTSGIRTQPN